MSQHKFNDARNTLESALVLAKQFNYNEKSLSDLVMNLAITYHHLKLNDEAKDNYKSVIELLSKSGGQHDLAVAKVNLATFLAENNDLKGAISESEEAVAILRNNSGKITPLASCLSNLAGFYYASQQYDKAEKPAQEAADLFAKELGKKNQFTRSAFSNLYQIAKKLGDEKKVKDVEAKWKSLDAIETKGPSKSELSDMLQEFFHTVKLAEPKANPLGFTKGPKLYKRQLEEFTQFCKSKGINVEEQAFKTVMNQEHEMVEMGIQQRSQVAQLLKEKREKIIEQRDQIQAKFSELLIEAEEFKQRKQEWQLFESEKYTNMILDDMEVPNLKKYLYESGSGSKDKDEDEDEDEELDAFQAEAAAALKEEEEEEEKEEEENVREKI
eukprot:TRINITY_DN5065_c0_g1_i1.p1 TRINITY_DN5065_c0_g1~~TRINITY_DN5065_c0_g1_i1.p1  ORF type:complete len:442 (+),score=131.40 TRINITY_DN5065_c0_g1_i1:173-1327(+)